MSEWHEDYVECKPKDGSAQAQFGTLLHEILEKNNGSSDVCLVGIKRRGIPLAKEIQNNILKFDNNQVPFGELDISFYRDDLSIKNEMPKLEKVALDFDVNDKTIILVDDVIYTGRTTRAAIEALFSLGRPKSIQLAVMIDRGHRELPIRPDFVGKNIPTSKQEHVRVMIPPFDDKWEVALFSNQI